MPDGATDENPEQADHKPALPAVVPQRLPALSAEAHASQAARVPVRKVPAIVQAALISGCLTVALIFGIGMFRSNRVETQVARADADTRLVVPASPAASGSAAPETPAAKARGAREKPHAAAATHTPAGMKLVRAHAARAPHAAADSPGKKTTAVLAKAPKKPHEDQPRMLLAQNSAGVPAKASAIQDEYAQCEQQSSFFQREQCKWRVCGGKWGQDGCPAYARDDREFN